MRRRVKVGKTFDLSVSVGDKTPAPEKLVRKETSPRRLAVGQEFNADITISENWGDAMDAITRSRIVWAVFAVIAAFLFGAAGLGFYRGEFSALQGVWGVTAPVYGCIAGYFFSRQENSKRSGKTIKR